MKLSASAREIKSKINNQKTNDKLNNIPPAQYIQDCWYPSNLINIIKSIINLPSTPMSPPTLMFTMTKEASEHNWEILKNHNLCLSDALAANNSSQLGPSSEFRPVHILQHVFKNHPLWPRVSTQLSEGADSPLDELDHTSRQQDLEEALEFGNHNGADNNPELFEKMINDDVTHGYSLVIPRDKVTQLKGALISPMNIVDQSCINERGEVIAKKRLTHNQSMIYGSGMSLNSRTQKDKLQDVMYGICLLRIIHQIVEYQRRHTSKSILIQKIDFKSAYRRTHLHASTGIQTITQLIRLGLCYISL